MTEVKAGYFIEAVKEKFDVDLNSEQDVENYARLINHWISDKQSGRAYFDNIPNDLQLDREFVSDNIEAISNLVNVRRFCSHCEVATPEECPYDRKQIEDTRSWEKEKGLALGTVKISKLLSEICVKNCDKPKEAEHEKMAVRPDLKYQNETFYLGYSPCSVKAKNGN